jgi:hypothetical protein
MSITLVIRLPHFPSVDTAGIVEALRPLAGPALLAVAETAGVGVLGKLLLTAAAKAAEDALSG